MSWCRETSDAPRRVQECKTMQRMVCTRRRVQDDECIYIWSLSLHPSDFSGTSAETSATAAPLACSSGPEGAGRWRSPAARPTRSPCLMVCTADRG
jgi:hypothetical protein